MFSTLLIAALLLHGLAHALFVANAWGYRRMADSAGFSPPYPTEFGPVAGALGLLWLAPLLGFLFGAWGFANGALGWQPLLFLSALVSSLLIALEWKRLNVSYALFASAFNVFVIALLYWNSQGLIFAG